MLGRRWLIVLVFSFAAATLATGLANATLPRLMEEKFQLRRERLRLRDRGARHRSRARSGLVGLARVGETAGRWIGAGLLVMAGLFGLLGLVDHAATALLVLGAIGFVDGTTDVLFETVVQREADPRHYGAVFGFSYGFITLTMMGAVAVAPLVNGLVAPGIAILCGAALLLVAGGIALLGMPKPARTKSRARRVRPDADLAAFLDRGGLEQLEPLEAGADLGGLLGARLDERQAQAADVVAEEVQRGLDRDRAGHDADQLVGRRELLVEPARRLDVARRGRAGPAPSPAARRRACGRRRRPIPPSSRNGRTRLSSPA